MALCVDQRGPRMRIGTRPTIMRGSHSREHNPDIRLNTVSEDVDSVMFTSRVGMAVRPAVPRNVNTTPLLCTLIFESEGRHIIIDCF